jgi:hypothetical protein
MGVESYKSDPHHLVKSPANEVTRNFSRRLPKTFRPTSSTPLLKDDSTVGCQTPSHDWIGSAIFLSGN